VGVLITSGAISWKQQRFTKQCANITANGAHIEFLLRERQRYAADEQLIQAVPTDISGFSLGCGDPITLARLQPAETVLDLGSGGGLDCFLAARQVGESGHVIGVDMTLDMLAKARANAERLKVQNVEFREGYLEALPVDDSSIDVVISNCVINLSPTSRRSFAKLFGC
jgi:SAM-dependent methyltransferase